LNTRPLLVQHLLQSIDLLKSAFILSIQGWLENGQDLYEPGTQRERAYMRGLSSIYQTNSRVDAATAAAMAVEEDIIDVIEVDTGN
jgi:hypothetical protein